MARCPKTMAEAFKRLDKRLTHEEKLQILDAKDMIDFHFGLGMWIRNYWIYTGEKENVESLMTDLGVKMFLGADDASSTILQAYQKHLKEKRR